MNFLFVCTANTCRSPMAEGILNKIAAEKGIDCSSDSAGLYSFDGQTANYKAIEVMKAYEVDLSNHKSRKLTQSIIDSSDMVLALTTTHRNLIKEIFKISNMKLFTLKEYEKKLSNEEVDSLDIADPYGGSIETYEICASQLYESIKNICKLIENTKNE